MDTSYRFRIYPNKRQEDQIIKTFGCCRFVWNYYISVREQYYAKNKKLFTFYECCKDLTALKKENNWLKDVDSSSLQNSLRDLDNAYRKFFSKDSAKPTQQLKRNYKQKYRISCVNRNIKLLENRIQLPKLGKVKCKVSKKIEGDIVNATVIKSNSGKYYVSIFFKGVDIKPLPKTNKFVGIDMGIKALAITSDGTEYQNPRYLIKSEKKLAKLQRKLSRKSKGSNRREKARIKVARLHEHIANQRGDMLHKLSTKIVEEYDIICIEDLDTQKMCRNHLLSKAIYDTAWRKFRDNLKYKSDWYGKKLVVVGRFYPSSQICSICGAKWNGTKDLSVREWFCPSCQTFHNRDINAAKNILKEGLRLIS